ncbi:MAG TPA: AEC family transporter, partial [Ruminococcus sp.]|nr:AEC family transporter [Ruminococcus sp.]
TGIICFKTGIITKSGNRELSNLVLSVVNPVVIFMAYQTEYDSELVKNLLTAFLLSVISFAILIAGAYILVPAKIRNSEIERFSSIYSNCAFMGIPLIQALFGSIGVFYLTAYLTVFNFMIWTHGIILLSGEKDFKKVLKVLYSPVILSIVVGIIMFFLQIKLPSVMSKALGFVADLNTPLAMIVSGVTMADADIISLIKKKRIYYTAFLKLILFPALITVIFALPIFSGIDSDVRTSIIIAASAPSAAMCTLQCIRIGKDSLYASEIFAFTTVFSVISLPLVVQFDKIMQNFF